MTTSETIDLNAVRRAYTPKADLDEARRNYEYDMAKFLKYSSAREISCDPAALAAFLTSAYHSLEKGLTMEIPRAGFGQGKIPAILAATGELERGGHDSHATRGARGCIRTYVRFHDKHKLPLPTHLESQLRAFVADTDDQQLPGGSIALTRQEIEHATNFDYSRFIETRRSVRHFTGDPVSPEVVHHAVTQALRSPRVCNRESRRVYAAYEPTLRNHLLSFHHGNRGFGHKLGAVLVVTVDLREFDMIGERNQGWVDGGLFAMSLIYSLHAARLGTCPLNWSEDCEHDQVFRNEFTIPDNEVIITLIGVGHIPDTIEVAASPTPTADGVLSDVSLRQDSMYGR
jgi:nitroreductase